MSTNTKQFLDYAGLSTFWGIITNRFADKSKTVTALSIEPKDGGKVQTIIGAMIEGGSATSVDLPSASRTQAGLMSPDHFSAVQDLQTNIDKFAPFAGLQLGQVNNVGTLTGSNEVSLTGRKATIALKYETEKSTDGTINNAYIELIDPNYPTTGRWVQITEAQYTAATDKTSYVAINRTNGTTEYYIWTDSPEGTSESNLRPTGVAGPVNALGEPLYNAPISKINVTELVKTGLLIDSDVVINPTGQTAGTYLKLVFNATNAEGISSPQTQYINVTDLVEVYTAGEGIEIANIAGEGANDDKQTGTIKVVPATDTTLGAVRVGYTEGNKSYAVKLDTNKHAYVDIPWVETHVTTGDSANRPNASATGTDITINVVPDTTNKEKTYTVLLGDKTVGSLNLADTAVQEISMMGTTLNKNSKVYTAEQAVKAMALGTASNLNVISDTTLATAKSEVEGPTGKVELDTIPNTTAVKTYVDNTKTTLTTGYIDFVTSKINDLDSEVAVSTIDGASTEQKLDAKAVFTKIVITDGKLDTAASVSQPLVLQDITNFRPLSETEIKDICGVIS